MAQLAVKVAALLLTVALLAPPCLSIPAKLDQQQGRDRSLLESGLGSAGYNYAVPAVPSGLYELPGPPSPPIIPSRLPTPATTTTSTTTTTTTTPPPPPPPPPSGLYGTPDREGGQTNLNPKFVTLRNPLEVPELPGSTPAPVTLTTPRGFIRPTPMMAKPKGPLMPYDINWGVDDRESGNVYSHSETSGGQDVQGEYRVLLPDGRTQVVSFWADPESGYNARVKYE